MAQSRHRVLATVVPVYTSTTNEWAIPLLDIFNNTCETEIFAIVTCVKWYSTEILFIK